MSFWKDPYVLSLAGLCLLALLFLLHRPLGRLMKLLLRSSLWLGVLALFSQAAPLLGVTPGVNLVNALVLGLLGAPGFGLLVMLCRLLR